MPIVVIDNSLVFKGVGCVFVDMTPFSSVRNFVVSNRIIELKLHSFLSLHLFDLLTALVLCHDSLRLSCNESVLAFRLVFYQFFKLLIELVFSLDVAYLRKIFNFLFERGVWINVVSWEASDFRLKKLTLVPQIFFQVVVFVVLLHDWFHSIRSFSFFRSFKTPFSIC